MTQPDTPHHHWPSATHMGDCDICGNVYDHPNHIDSPSYKPHTDELERPLVRYLDHHIWRHGYLLTKILAG